MIDTYTKVIRINMKKIKQHLTILSTKYPAVAVDASLTAIIAPPIIITKKKISHPISKNIKKPECSHMPKGLIDKLTALEVPYDQLATTLITDLYN